MAMSALAKPAARFAVAGYLQWRHTRGKQAKAFTPSDAPASVEPETLVEVAAQAIKDREAGRVVRGTALAEAAAEDIDRSRFRRIGVAFQKAGSKVDAASSAVAHSDLAVAAVSAAPSVAVGWGVGAAVSSVATPIVGIPAGFVASSAFDFVEKKTARKINGRRSRSAASRHP